MSATVWLSLTGVVLVALVGGALIGVPVGAAVERRRARRMRERARRALRRLPPTTPLPVLRTPPLVVMRDQLRWTRIATPTERSRR